MARHFVVTPTAIAAASLIAFYAGILFVVELFTDGENRLRRLVEAPWAAQSAAWLYFATMTLLFHARRAYEFLYFQF